MREKIKLKVRSSLRQLHAKIWLCNLDSGCRTKAKKHFGKDKIFLVNLLYLLQIEISESQKIRRNDFLL